MGHQRLFRGHPWLDVVEQRARLLSRRRTGSEAFWEFYMFDVSADMYDEITAAQVRSQEHSGPG